MPQTHFQDLHKAEGTEYCCSDCFQAKKQSLERPRKGAAAVNASTEGSPRKKKKLAQKPYPVDPKVAIEKCVCNVLAVVPNPFSPLREHDAHAAGFQMIRYSIVVPGIRHPESPV